MTSGALAAKRARLLALAALIPDDCRLVEKSPGSALGRRIAKLKRFGPRYVTWALNRAGILQSREVGFPLFFGKKMRLPFKLEDDFVTLYLTGALGGPEHKLTKFFVRHLRPGDVFYDVGASYGFYSQLAGEFLPPERIHSFEPLPEIFACLRSNARGGENLNNVGLWDKEGSSEINVHHLGHGFSTLSPEMVVVDPPRGGAKVVVKTTTLDDYVKTHAAPTVMKVDIEGAEEKLIAGGRRCLSENSPVVSMEVIGGKAAQLSLRALQKMLELGYHAFSLTEDGQLADPLAAPLWSARLDAMARGNTADQIAWDNVIFQKGNWAVPPAR